MTEILSLVKQRDTATAQLMQKVSGSGCVTVKFGDAGQSASRDVVGAQTGRLRLDEEDGGTSLDGIRIKREHVRDAVVAIVRLYPDEFGPAVFAALTSGAKT